MEFMKILSASFLLVVATWGNDEFCRQIQPWQREKCGWPGITPQQCSQSLGCCFDSSIMNVPWCFQKVASILNFENGFVPPPPQPAAFKYSGNCLFHCTSVRVSSRVPCGGGDVSEDECLRMECCFDARATFASANRCFYPETTSRCPSPRCQMPSGRIQACQIRRQNRYALNCELYGCCTWSVGNQRFCYKEETPPMQPTTQAPTTTTTTTRPTRRPTKLELIRRQNGGSLGGFTLYEMLTLSLKDLVRNNTVDQERSNLEPTQPPTTIATTVRYNTPTTTPSPPKTRLFCRFGRCRYVFEPTEPPTTCEPKKCGVSYFTPPRRTTQRSSSLKKIVGGNRAYPFSQPWTAMLLKREKGRTFVCGAAIICNHWLVTAAHCLNSQTTRSNVPDLDAAFYTVYVGRYTGWREKSGSQVQIFRGREGIDFLEQHENFRPGVTRGVITNDIAVIRLKRSIKFGNYSQPICLPEKEPTINTIAWATGWGITKNRGPDDSRLKIVGQLLLNKTRCEQEVPQFSTSNTDGLVCAGGEQNHDTCTGDSGGPLVGYKNGGAPNSDGKRQFELVGLTSLGSPNCNTLRFDRQPALYVDIFHYLPWIRARTHYCCRSY